MTPSHFTACLEQIGWTQRSLARALRHQRTQVRRWADGMSPVPDAVERWLTSAAEWHAAHPPPSYPFGAAVTMGRRPRE